jgi:tripartite-type tricarboxylate transporter receptor subunit TctC
MRRDHGIAAALLFAGVSCALAQPAGTGAYPSRPIRMNVTTLPGGAPDIVARVVGQKLGDAMGQSVVVENRPGSNGNIAAEATAKAPPDGHTLMVCAEVQLVVNPHLYKKLPYDAQKDLTVIATLVSNEFVLTINPALPVRNFKEFLSFARTSNPPLNYASAGNGSQHHLTMEMLKSRAGLKMVHVPYKGGTAAATATVSGEVAAVFAGSSSAPQIKAGRLRALAVASPKRMATFPDLPAIAEFFPGFSNRIWLAMCGPAGLPEPVVTRLRTEVNRILQQPDTRERFTAAGALEPYITTPAELAALVKSEFEKYGKVVRDIGVTLD